MCGAEGWQGQNPVKEAIAASDAEWDIKIFLEIVVE